MRRPLETALVVVAFELELFDEHRFALPCYHRSHRVVARMTIDIRPELEAKLAAHARALGMPVQRFVEDVLEREAQSATANAPHRLAGREKAQAFRNRASSFPADLPVLTLQDVSRENLYRRD